MSIPNQQKNTYFLDAENGAEMTRLQHQDRMFTHGMGGLRPECANQFNGIKHILDIGCGPGGWVLDLAQRHPEIEITGMDVSILMIEYARMSAQVYGLRNANFRVMDANQQPLDFAGNSFDMVNARFIVSFMPKEAWPALLKECRRLLKPGGILRLTEAEVPLSPVSAFNQLSRMTIYALKEAGYGFTPTQLGITAVLGPLMRRAGYQDVRYHPYFLEYVPGNLLYDSFLENCKLGFKLIQPFLIKTGAGTPAEVELAYQEAMIEINQPDFFAISHLITAWGTT